MLSGDVCLVAGADSALAQSSQCVHGLAHESPQTSPPCPTAGCPQPFAEVTRVLVTLETKEISPDARINRILRCKFVHGANTLRKRNPSGDKSRVVLRND